MVLDDDSKLEISLIEKEIIKLADEYILNVYEIQNIGDNFGADITSKTIKEIYAQNDRCAYIDSILKKYIEIEMKYRTDVSLDASRMEDIIVRVLKEAPEV